MKLKNKYSKQIIYNNQKFEDQIWYNQQIMTFLNFSQLLKSVFCPNFPGKHFPENKPNFSLTRKCFLLINFSNSKQTQESLEIDFPETTFRKTNIAKRENTFLETKPNFSLTGKCFPLTNFSNGKQTQKSLESSFLETPFQETNMAFNLSKLTQISVRSFVFMFLNCFLF